MVPSDGTDQDIARVAVTLDGLWHTLVAVYTPAFMILYYDGVAGTPISNPVEVRSSYSTINVGTLTGTSYFAKTKINSMRVFNREITPAEVADGSWETSNVDLVVGSSFGETIGATIYDVSSNGLDGIMSGGATHATDNGIPSYFALHGGRISGGVLIPALLDGSECADGNPIENGGGHTYNGSGVTFAHTDYMVLDAVRVLGLGYDDKVLPFKEEAGGKPRYEVVFWDFDLAIPGFVTITVTWGFGTWSITTSGLSGETDAVSSSAPMPPETIGIYTVARGTEGNEWVDSAGNFVTKVDADWAARTNVGENQVDRWAHDAVCVVEEVALYSMAFVQNLAWYNAAEAWRGEKGCGTPPDPFINNYVAESGDNYIAENGDNYIGE